ncbi:PhzF family phenazine biosynthesis protein [Tsuneonella sp. HG094]
MTGLPYWQVDAFADRAFSGNPAGVVLPGRSLTRETMQAIAAELGLPATAFVEPENGAGVRPIHWFDGARPIGLCGHATLAAGHVVLSQGKGNARFVAPDGRMLEVTAHGERRELALPAISTAPRELPELAEFLGAEPVEMHFNEDGYALAIYRSADAVERLAPDFAALRGLGWQVTATAPAPAGSAEAIVSRVFTRVGGEDQATGSAHAVLTPYWVERLGMPSFLARQASARGASFGCTLDGDLVRLSGGCVTVIEGTLYLPG